MSCLEKEDPYCYLDRCDALDHIGRYGRPEFSKRRYLSRALFNLICRATAFVPEERPPAEWLIHVTYYSCIYFVYFVAVPWRGRNK